MKISIVIILIAITLVPMVGKIVTQYFADHPWGHWGKYNCHIYYSAWWKIYVFWFPLIFPPIKKQYQSKSRNTCAKFHQKRSKTVTSRPNWQTYRQTSNERKNSISRQIWDFARFARSVNNICPHGSVGRSVLGSHGLHNYY